MKNTIIAALLLVLSLAVPALAAQQDIAQLSAITASREALRTAINTQLSAVQANFDEVYAVIDAGPVYVNASAPADTKVVWIDMDQDNAIKVHVGGVWTVVGSGGEGSYTLPTAAADTLGGVKVGDRLTITDGLLSADVQTTDISGKENSLGNPSTSGYVLSSTTSGVRSWIEMTGGGTGIAHATSDGNYYASKDGGWASLAGVFLTPTGSADSLTITDTGTYFTTDTVAAALQELGSELADVTEITLDASLTETGGVLSVTNPVTDYDTDGDGDFTDESWFPAAGIGGSTGSMDNAILRANGTGGSTAQASGVTIDDSDNITTTGFITGLMQPVVITTAEGADDTSTDAAFLTDSGESWPTNAYVGMTLYNLTDVSSCVVTANTATTMTCTLAGGTDNDWDSADAWAVAPGPKQSGSMFYIGSATTILHPAIAGYGVCYMTTGANAVSVDPQSASMALYLNGATIGDGDEIDIPNTAGNYACLHNKSTAIGYVLGTKGTIADGGSN